MKPLIYTACDQLYFMEHSIAFCKSAAKHQHQVFIDVVPTIGVINESEFDRFLDKFKTSFSDEEKKYVIKPNFFQGMYALELQEPRAYYACFRFLRMLELLEKMDNILVLDIDSLVNNPIQIDDKYDLGIYLRENENLGSTPYEKEGMKTAAGISYFTQRSTDFLIDVHNIIVENPVRWFCDQYALYEAYKKHKDSLEIFDFGKHKEYMDWEFKADTLIWTGKGDRKYKNETYINRKKEIENW